MRHAGLVLVLTLGLSFGCADSPPEAASGASVADLATPSGSEQTRGSDGGSADLPRVVFLGTSLTAGYGLDEPATQGWVGRIDALADSAAVPVEAVNAGSSGDTSSGGLRRLGWILGEPLELLVVELGANDGLRGQDIDALAGNLREIVERTRAAYPGAAVALVAMEAPRNMGSAYVERFRQVFPRVASETGATLIPFPLEEVAGRPELNLPDGIHPTPRGHDVMARAAWPYLLPLLQDITADRTTDSTSEGDAP